MQLPVRQSLVAQTAEALRQGIRRGVWRDRLPGERELARQLTVSRPTLRDALDLLEQDGWVGNARPRTRRRIRKTIRASRKSSVSRVTLLSDTYPHGISYRLRAIVDELRETLPKLEVTLEILPYPRATPEHADAALDAMIREHPASAWILTRASPAFQRGFARRALPTLVYGTCYPGVDLPSFAINHGAVCRHAVALFRRHGHQRLAMVSTQLRVAGDFDSERAFLTAARMPEATADASARILRFDGSREDLMRRLNTLWQLSSPPTALLCDQSAHALTVLCYARQRGLTVPGDVSLLSRMYDPLLTWTCPPISHYQQDLARLTRKMMRLILQLIQHGPLPPRSWRVIPTFVPAETVAAPSANLVM